MKESDYVAVAAFSDPDEAHLAETRLRAAGIDSFLDNEFTVAANPLFGPALGGINLFVTGEDVDEAREILDEFREDRRAYEEEAEHNCPKCGSEHIGANFGHQFLLCLLIVLTLGLIWLILYRRRRCWDCGHTW